MSIVGMDANMKLEFWYRSPNGLTTKQCVQPIKIFFGTAQGYTQEQWLMEAYDYKLDIIRFFAMQSMGKA